MICLMDSGSRLSIATIVFYTCIWIPVKQMKQAILDVFSSICSQLKFRVAKIGFRDHDDEHSSSRSVVMDDLLLPAKFNDVVVCAVVQQLAIEGDGDGDGDNRKRCCCYGGGGESCSICLAEYDGEDMVIRLPRCGHVFHMECINSWLHRSQFTCPLCRDLFLCVNNVDDVRTR